MAEEDEEWIAGFEIPTTLQEAEGCWQRIRAEEEAIARELQEYRDSRHSTILELEEMQRRLLTGISHLALI